MQKLIGKEGTTDPEKIFTKQERIGCGNFGEVFKGYVIQVDTNNEICSYINQ